MPPVDRKSEARRLLRQIEAGRILAELENPGEKTGSQVTRVQKKPREGADALERFRFYSRSDDPEAETLREGARADLLKTAKGMPVWDRLKTKTVVDEGVESYLKNKYGSTNVERVSDNNFAVRDKGELLLVEDAQSKGIAGTLTELALDAMDFVPEIAEGVVAQQGAGIGGAAGLALGGNPLSAAAGAVGGAALGGAGARGARIALSEAMGAEPFPEGVDAAKDIATAGATEGVFGAATELALPLLKGIGRSIPFSETKKLKRLANEGEFIGRQARPVIGTEGGVEVRAGVPKSLVRSREKAPGEVYQKALEEEARYRAVWPGAAREADVQTLGKLSEDYERVVKNIADGKLTGETSTNALALAEKKTIQNIKKDLDTVGGQKYEALKTFAGSHKMFNSPGAEAIIDDTLRLFPESAAPKIREMKKQFGKMQTVGDFIAFRRKARDAATGDLTLDPDLSPAQNRLFGNRLMDAITEDLDKIPETLLKSPILGARRFQAAQLLKDANEYWKQGAKKIKAIENTTLATEIKKFLRTPEGKKVSLQDMSVEDLADTQKFVTRLRSKALTDNKVRSIFRVADRVAPRAANNLRLAVVDDIFAKAMLPPADPIARAVGAQKVASHTLDLGKFSSALNEGDTLSRVQAILGDGPSYQALKIIADDAASVKAALSEVAKVSAGGSTGISQLAGAGGVLGGGGAGARLAAGLAGRAERSVLRIARPRRVFFALMNPKGAGVFLEAVRAVKTRGKGAQTKNAIGRLARMLHEGVQEEKNEPPIQ